LARAQDPDEARTIAQEAFDSLEGELEAVWGKKGSAIGDGSVSALGAMFGERVDESHGFGGLGVAGVGRGGGGFAEDSIGLDQIGTRGRGGRFAGDSIGLGQIGAVGRGDQEFGRPYGHAVVDIDKDRKPLKPAGGEGYGQGQLKSRSRKIQRPRVIPGRPVIRGSLDKEIIRRVIRRHRNEYRYCYEKQLNKEQDLSGKISVKFTIAGNGSIIASSVSDSTMNNSDVESCLTRKIKRWVFPAPKGGGIVTVKYPFIFKPGSGKQRSFRAPPPPPPPPPPLSRELPRHLKPENFLPRIFYFENTYLGGNAAYAERLRRLDRDFKGQGLDKPYRLAQLQVQEFDPPREAGLALYTQLDLSYLDKPSRVILQVGLQGSHRYGWRRPPLDLMLLVDHPVSANFELLMSAVSQLLKKLSPQDRLGIILAGEQPRVLSPLRPTRLLRRSLARLLEEFKLPSDHGPAALRYAIEEAGRQFNQAADAQVRIPGSQVLLMLVKSTQRARVREAEVAIHRLSLQGVVSSVIDLASSGGPWWSVAHAGNGNLHSLDSNHKIEDLIEEELSSLSKVIARLLRLNIRLAPGVKAVRVLGSRKLKAREVKEVKAREVATDRNLSKSLGLKADRGEDGDGVQTVIPYFYGGDSHVILLELWVEKAGAIADVSLDFKDMVRLRNAQARASVSLGKLPRQETPMQQVVKQNRKGFRFAEALERASIYAAREERSALKRSLVEAKSFSEGPADLKLVQGFLNLLDSGLLERKHQLLVEALELSSRLRIGSSASL